MAFQSGFISLIGRPNVGKSTLLNAIIGRKVAITTPKAQTTRNNIRGIYNAEDCQIVFVDTPGIHEPRQLLGSKMVKEAWSSLAGVDAAYLVIDGKKGFTPADEFILKHLKDSGAPIILVVNKIDGLRKAGMLELLGSLNTADFASIVPVSALSGDNIAELLSETKKYLRDTVRYYPEDKATDYPEQFIISEVIREKLMNLTKEEVPHSLAVTIEKMEFKKNSAVVYALILVEKDSQKGIVIGKDGSLLKEVGIAARPEIEAILGKRVYLELYVRVEKDWRNRESKLKQLGFVEPVDRDE